MLRACAAVLTTWSFLLTGCASGPRPPRLEEVLGTWQIVGVEVPAGAKLPTVTFTGDGRIHGNGGVNRYNATLDPAALAQGQWRPGPLNTTRMAGSAGAMHLESSFLGALGAATDVALQDGRLLLRQHGRLLLTLAPWTLR